MIRIENLSKAFGTRVLLDKLTYHFPEGERIALVGANGAGKTTLLNIVCGLEEPDAGSVIRPGRMRLGYLPQEPNPTPEASVLEELCMGGAGALQELYRQTRNLLQRLSENYSDEAHAAYERVEVAFRNQGGYALEAKARRILNGLGFDDDLVSRNPKALSGGWRMRLELAKVLLNSPDFLVLDEPTNHLDLPSLVWVEGYLQSFSGTLLFVSHDRSLLERLPTQTLHLQRGELTPYAGNFSAFLEERERRLEEAAATSEALRKRREALERFVQRFGAKASKARQAQSKAKQIARLKDLESDMGADDDESTLALNLPSPPASGQQTLALKDLSIGYERALARGINLRVMRGQKIAVIGANGIGKSTLIKTIAGRLSPLAGEVALGHNVAPAYFAQDQLETLNDDQTVLANVMRSGADAGPARTLLGSFLFRGDDVFKPVGVLSGGEKSRVGLACLLSERANLLLLDEPTNHLDIASAEILAQALADFEGTAIFVSHDRAFIDSVCTHVFAMLPDGRSALFEGQLADYERLAQVAGFPNVLDISEAVSPKPTSAKPAGAGDDQIAALRKERQRLERRREQLEASIAAANAALESVQKELLTPDLHFSRLTELGQQGETLRRDLESQEDAWLEACERLEAIATTLREAGRL